MTWLSEWAQKTSCHGIPDFQDSKNVCQKLFWLAVILAAFGAIVFYQTSLVQYVLPHRPNGHQNLKGHRRGPALSSSDG